MNYLAYALYKKEYNAQRKTRPQTQIFRMADIRFFFFRRTRRLSFFFLLFLSLTSFFSLHPLSLSFFLSLSRRRYQQNDDLALAKALQDQEHAFALLATSAAAATAASAGTAAVTTRTGGGRRRQEGGNEGDGEGDDDEEEEEEELDDEALAWKLHEQMEREHLMALAGMLPGQDRQLAGVEGEGDGNDDEGGEDIDEDIDDELEGEEEEGEDPASLSYERLTALTDVVGVVPKKASESALSKVVVGPYVPRGKRVGRSKGEANDKGARGCGGGGDGGSDGGKKEQEEEEEEKEQCAICRVELETGEEAATLPCGHSYHHESCLLPWLERAKSCPVCNAELE